MTRAFVKLTDNQIERARAFADEFAGKYLETDAGRAHLESYARERQEVEKVFADIEARYSAGQDVTDDVLYHLLPHSDTQGVRQRGYRVSTWPAITVNVKKWFENAGWQERENWPKVALAILTLVRKLVRDRDESAIQGFLATPYSKGFQAGMLSPIFYCLDDEYLVINSKTVDTVNFLAEASIISSSLEEYLSNVSRVRALMDQVDSAVLDSFPRFDAFCHWMCSRRLGGYVRRPAEVAEAPPEEKVEIADHWQAIRVLVELGNLLGYATYVADPGKMVNGVRLGELARAEGIPEAFSAVKDIKRVDSIWFSKQRDKPSYFFEVEQGGNMRDALLRLYQMMILNAELFVVCPIENKPKFEQWVGAEPFHAVRERFKFRSYEQLAKFYDDAKVYHASREDFFGG